MCFYLGTHQPSWLRRATVPLFLSAIALRRLKTIAVASCEWALDSGGFSELSLRSRWTVSPESYAMEVVRWSIMAGRPPNWAAIQDWMCEPFILAKTGKTVREHQALTIESLRTLRGLAPTVRWIPVVQGWTVDDYARHVDAYTDAGFDLTAEPVVGVGSVCRRQGTREALAIFTKLARLGLRTHAFGVKRDGLALFGDRIVSSDSMAWSFVARRRNIQLAECAGTHRNCANCFRFAMQWRAQLVAGRIQGPAQQELAL